MKTRSVMLAALLLVLAVPLASAVSAEQISGSGTLWAHGAGLAFLRGSGRVEVQGHGAGLVWIKDSEHLEASGQGHRWHIPETGATVFCGWSGTIRASGHDMTVWMAGALIEFTASGTGKAYLQGRGTYRVNHYEGEWSPAGSVVRLDDALSSE